MSIWSEGAAQAIKDGYLPGSWQPMLDRYLKENFPNLVQELEALGDYENYLVTRVEGAREKQSLMIEQGTAPQAARELALAELLPAPSEEEEERDE